MREKLIELLREVQYQGNAVHGFHDKYIQNSELADHLIANDVVPVVRCKDCDYFVGDCDKYESHCRLHASLVDEDDFCSYGERREGE